MYRATRWSAPVVLPVRGSVRISSRASLRSAGSLAFEMMVLNSWIAPSLTVALEDLALFTAAARTRRKTELSIALEYAAKKSEITEKYLELQWEGNRDETHRITKLLVTVTMISR